MSMRRFESVRRYLDALEQDPSLSVLSMSMAAEEFNVGRAAIDAMVRSGRLLGVKIGRPTYVLTRSIFEKRKEREKQVEIVERLLEKIASKREFCFYEPIMEKLGLSWKIPNHRRLIGEILGDVSRGSKAKHRLLLSVLVHKKTAGKTRPSDAFFSLAKELGYTVEDEDEFVRDQLKKVWDYYRQ